MFQSNEPPDTMSTSGFSNLFRPRLGLPPVPVPTPRPLSTLPSRSTPDPMLSAVSSKPKVESTVGCFPYKALEKFVSY